MTDSYSRQMRYEFTSSVDYSMFQGNPFFVPYNKPFFMFIYFPLEVWENKNLYLPIYFKGYPVILRSNDVI